MTEIENKEKLIQEEPRVFKEDVSFFEIGKPGYSIWCLVGWCFPTVTGFLFGRKVDYRFRNCFLVLLIIMLAFFLTIAGLNINFEAFVTENGLTDSNGSKNEFMRQATDDFMRQGILLICMLITCIGIKILFAHQRRQYLAEHEKEENICLTCCIVSYCLPCSFGQLGALSRTFEV